MSWYQFVIIATTVTSLCMQVYVIFIIIRKSPDAMSEYRYFICFIAFWDMLLNVSLGIVMDPDPIFPVKGSIVNGLIKYIGPSGAEWSFGISAFCIASIVFGQTYCLVYRLTVILQSSRYHEVFVSKRGYAAGHLFYLVVAFSVGFTSFHAIAGPNERLVLVAKYPQSVALVHDGDVLVIIDRNKWTQWAFAFILAGLVVAQLLSFAAIFGILRTLRKDASSFTAKTYRLHLQLTILLLAQLAAPVVFVGFPVVAAVVAMSIHWPMTATSGRFGIILMTMYGPTNASLTMFFVAPYRNYTKDVLLKFLPTKLWRVWSKQPAIAPARAISTTAASSTIAVG